MSLTSQGLKVLFIKGSGFTGLGNGLINILYPKHQAQGLGPNKHSVKASSHRYPCCRVAAVVAEAETAGGNKMGVCHLEPLLESRIYFASLLTSEPRLLSPPDF